MLRHRYDGAVAATLYFILAAGTIHLTSTGNDIATIWPANAVLLTLLLRTSSKRRWIEILGAGFAANVAANLLTRGLGPGPFLFGLCNLIEVGVAAHLLRPVLFNMHILGAPAVVARFIAVAGVFAPTVSGIGGAGTAWYFYGQDFWDAFQTWLLSDGLGLLIFTPFLRALFAGDYIACFRSKTWQGRCEAIALQVLTACVALIVFFFAERPLLFLLFAPVMLATFRMGRLGTKAAVLIIALVGSVATIWDVGPIAAVATDPREQALLFQAYLASLLLVCLPAAADLTARAANLLSLANSASEREAREMELYRRATTDNLTGVLNRAAFRERTEFMMRKGDGSLSLVALDLDHFKHVNDRYGHPAGDKALTHVVAVLHSALRAPDIIGRIGGDEFLVLLPSADRARAEAIAARLASALRDAPLELDGGVSLLLSMSCGVAQYEDGMSYDDLVGIADRALYARKARSQLSA